jgi:hypothetical protein
MGKTVRTLGCLVALAALTHLFGRTASAGVEVLGAGFSAMWQTAALGAFNQLAGKGAQHYTVSGTCTAGGNCAQIYSRSAKIPNQGGDLWVVWNSGMTEIWAYISVDSLVGNRAYFATPRAALQVDPLTQTAGGVPPGQTNLISSNLWASTPRPCRPPYITR